MIRQPQPNDYAELQHEIAKLQERAAGLAEQNAAAAAELEAALGRDTRDFSEPEVRATRNTLARIEAEEQLVSDRIEALKGRLPGPEARQQAMKEAAHLRDEAIQGVAAFASRWPAFIAALRAAETIGRELIAARGSAHAARFALIDLKASMGLEVQVPGAPAAPPSETKYAGLLASWLRDVAYVGTEDDTTARDLRAAEAECAPFAVSG